MIELTRPICYFNEFRLGALACEGQAEVETADSLQTNQDLLMPDG